MSNLKIGDIVEYHGDKKYEEDNCTEHHNCILLITDFVSEVRAETINLYICDNHKDSTSYNAGEISRELINKLRKIY